MTMVRKKFRNEPFDVLFKRFKKTVERADVVGEVRRREHYERPSIARKRAKEIAVKNEQRRQEDQRLKRAPV